MTDTRSKRWKSAARVVGDFVTGCGGGEQQSEFNFVRGCKNIPSWRCILRFTTPRAYKFISLILRLQHQRQAARWRKCISASLTRT
jgi:hypothetical protein